MKKKLNNVKKIRIKVFYLKYVFKQLWYDVCMSSIIEGYPVNY